MDTEQRRQALEGCYVTVPTPFADRKGWPTDDSALRTYVRFLIDNGLHGDRATLLAGGAAGMALPAAALDDARLRLNWMYYGSHAGFALGKDSGGYRDAGINLDIRSGNGSSSATGSSPTATAISPMARAPRW